MAVVKRWKSDAEESVSGMNWRLEAPTEPSPRALGKRRLQVGGGFFDVAAAGNPDAIETSSSASSIPQSY
jgi:hypothetical protein